MRLRKAYHGNPSALVVGSVKYAVEEDSGYSIDRLVMG